MKLVYFINGYPNRLHSSKHKKRKHFFECNYKPKTKLLLLRSWATFNISFNNTSAHLFDIDSIMLWRIDFGLVSHSDLRQLISSCLFLKRRVPTLRFKMPKRESLWDSSWENALTNLDRCFKLLSCWNTHESGIFHLAYCNRWVVNMVI